MKWRNCGIEDHTVDTHVFVVQKEQYGIYWFQAKQVPLTKLSLSNLSLRLTYFGISAMRSKCLFAELAKNGMSTSLKMGHYRYFCMFLTEFSPKYRVYQPTDFQTWTGLKKIVLTASLLYPLAIITNRTMTLAPIIAALCQMHSQRRN